MASVTYDPELDKLALNPFWQYHPKKFWGGHQSAIKWELQEWQATDPNLNLSTAVARYLNGLPTDLPADIILKITALFIEEWEKQAAPIAVEELAG